MISHKSEPFLEVLEGFRKYHASHGPKTGIDIHHIEGNPDTAVKTAREVKRENPDLIFTLGALATDVALREFKDVPIVSGMVFRPDAVRKSPNATCVHLEFPLETQFRWLRKMLPDARTVGVLYNPGENRQKIEAAARIAKAMGLRLEAREVGSPRDLPGALESLARRADVLWGIYDSVVTAPEAVTHILLFSFRNRIPVAGLSSSWVKAGALYSLDWDYPDLGKQCGESAQRILQGETPASIPCAPPRKAFYSVNLNTARLLKIGLPESIVRGAERTF
jgi:putative ABC transport system substrate-binding protein